MRLVRIEGNQGRGPSPELRIPSNQHNSLKYISRREHSIHGKLRRGFHQKRSSGSQGQRILLPLIGDASPEYPRWRDGRQANGKYDELFEERT
ncbi:hypothetical protein BDM02DRAFT_1511669 [Thelephora ganbajun]|uniref:Uncharacterized protein n=1 Tax=Thelephora ganbajun TaxID=370292 RepID=A0ACB6Z0W9_THEGA|nr:hypothetical protein BDM02DRAFT_1511669 [Thelephora ganbajun]